jgi:hypothetical protein
MQLINNEFYTIYVIQLEKHKIYVFKTRDHKITKHNILQSPDLHLNEWVKLYKPLEVIDAFYTHDENADTNEVKEYMKLHGVSNVRGGIFQDIEIQKKELMAPLIEELTQPFNPCSLCGKTNHLTACCPAFTKYDEYDEYNRTLKIWRDDYEKWKYEHENKWKEYNIELNKWTQQWLQWQAHQIAWNNQVFANQQKHQYYNANCYVNKYKSSRGCVK